MSKKRVKKHFTVGFVALGCPKNIVDSEKMLGSIGQAGFILAESPDNADIVVINTCGFIQPAKEEAIEAIQQAVNQKGDKKVGKVVVTGCLAERMGQELFSEVQGIDAVVGLGQRDRIAEILQQLINTRKAPKSSAPTGSLFMKNAGEISDDRGRLLITPGHWAYLRISEGCDRRCAFCTIPSIRGSFRSKDQDIIVSEADELAQNGAAEIDIIAQDSNYYGRDLGQKNGLSDLIKKLETVDGLQWLRLMYFYPDGIDDELIQTIADSKKVVNYIDMPIQHINDDILKAMRRSDRKAKTIDLVNRLRAAMPDVVLRTTVIVGFPGETDQQFEELLEFVEWAQFDALGCFTFYPEQGTPAAEMPDQIDEQIKAERLERLMLTQQKIAFEKAKDRIGTELLCMVDYVDGDGTGQARFFGQAPQIDSICIINDCTVDQGQFVRLKVIDADGYDLIVEQL